MGSTESYLAEQPLSNPNTKVYIGSLFIKFSFHLTFYTKQF